MTLSEVRGSGGGQRGASRADNKPRKPNACKRSTLNLRLVLYVCSIYESGTCDVESVWLRERYTLRAGVDTDRDVAGKGKHTQNLA